MFPADLIIKIYVANKCKKRRHLNEISTLFWVSYIRFTKTKNTFYKQTFAMSVILRVIFCLQKTIRLPKSSDDLYRIHYTDSCEYICPAHNNYPFKLPFNFNGHYRVSLAVKSNWTTF